MTLKNLETVQSNSEIHGCIDVKHHFNITLPFSILAFHSSERIGVNLLDMLNQHKQINYFMAACLI